MTEEIEAPDHNPKGFTRHPLYTPTLVVYWIFVGAMVLNFLGSLVGFWDAPALWLTYVAIAPVTVFVFFAILEDVIEDAVYEGTRRAMSEMLEHMDDMLPEEDDVEKMEALYNSEPAGRA